MTNQLPDMAQIMQLAQKVASQIEPPDAIKNGEKLSEKEMSKVFDDISKSVSEIITPEMFSGSGMGMGGANTKKLGNRHGNGAQKFRSLYARLEPRIQSVQRKQCER